MILKNTSRYPTEEVAALVRFGCKGVNMTGVAVNVKNCSRAFAGRAYEGVPLRSPLSRDRRVLRLVTLRVGEPKWFPLTQHYTKRSPFIILNDWRECLVYLAAHESRHIYQFRHSLPRSEVDCERFAFQRLIAFRGQERR